jgi:hypothetical protein
MSESSKVRAFGVLGALAAASVLATGCSAAAPGEGGSAPEVKDQGVSTEMFTPLPINVIPGTPIPPSCIYWDGTTYQTLPAHYVEKVPNDWGKRPLGVNYTVVANPYNGHGPDPRFGDGYSIPFPTPWVTAGSTQPDPHTYEQSLWWIPSTLWWEYLVHDITPPPPGSRTYVDDIAHAYFMVGIPAITDYDRASTLASANAGSPVDARVNKCVRILTRTNSTIFDTGESFLVLDEHDPRSPPD